MVKTKLCVLYANGECVHGGRCRFAHDPSELRQRPDLRKTSLCRSFTLSGCCVNGAQCRFAHGKEQLRAYDVDLPYLPCASYHDPTNSVEEAFGATWRPTVDGRQQPCEEYSAAAGGGGAHDPPPPRGNSWSSAEYGSNTPGASPWSSTSPGRDILSPTIPARPNIKRQQDELHRPPVLRPTKRPRTRSPSLSPPPRPEPATVKFLIVSPAKQLPKCQALAAKKGTFYQFNMTADELETERIVLDHRAAQKAFDRLCTEPTRPPVCRYVYTFLFPSQTPHFSIHHSFLSIQIFVDVSRATQ